MILLKRNLLIIGILTLILNLLITFPAKVAFNFLDTTDVYFNEIEGSLWKGSAKNISYGKFYLNEMHWDINVIEIFKGALSYNIKAKPQSGSFKAKFNFKFNGTMFISKLASSLPLSIFSSVTGIPGLKGRVILNFDQLKILDGVPFTADGKINITDLVIPLVGSDQLGNYELSFITQEKNVLAKINDTEGIVNFNGTLKIENNRSFEILGMISPKPETPTFIRQQLLFLPAANKQGQQELRLEGIL